MKKKAGFDALKNTDYTPEGMVKDLMDFTNKFFSQHGRNPTQKETNEMMKPI
ncbi:hypothetical protein GLW08_19565 [Pontibacillus yanchengensis]|uniref:Uncharacterized protein n=2 Tax=Pontibacillus yanchengensis TaxID=462910 RepID=A0ACC7VKJ8_9BACI|nr:hypothetical protein [Pontibacillus yanchengensis]MYL35553.1 hypothetical protein [Pontibacillus yanchengensis]MYL55508.1 hypothetical protein [Pontibacillus yanchengensis]